MYGTYQMDDATAEALLAGRAVPDELAPLARALTAYREAVQLPVRPTRELAEGMATGRFGRPPTRPGRARRPAARGTAARRVRPATLAGAGAVVAVLVAGVATAGAAGALPEPVQHRFDTVVNPGRGGGAPAVPAPAPGPDGSGTPAGPGSGNSEFGDRVREDARTSGVDGPEVSESAQPPGDRRRPVDPPEPAGPARPAEPRQPTAPPAPDPAAPGGGAPPDTGPDRPVPGRQ